MRLQLLKFSNNSKSINHEALLIVCAGITYSSDFRMAFVDEGLEFKRETHDGRELQWVVNKNGTTVVVIPFMVNQYGLTKNVSIQKFGNRIREIIS